MIKIENTQIFGLEPAIRGMRSPKNSWDRSDSMWCIAGDPKGEGDYYTCRDCPLGTGNPSIDCDCPGCITEYALGPNDLELAKKLVTGGPVHAKFRRMITVYCDITAPLYWWKEYDTYKVGTVANSTSTMHKIHAKEFTLDDFSHEHLLTREDVLFEDPNVEEEHSKIGALAAVDVNGHACYYTSEGFLKMTCDVLNYFRELYLKTKDKTYWWQMIQLLPSSYNQKRTVMLNYEVLANIYKWRKDHKLDCWHTFCDWIESLPYSELITGEKKEE